MHANPPPQPDPIAPAEAPRHTTIINSDVPVTRVEFAEADDGTWFKVLHWLIDSGTWASLPDAARSVLIVLARHRSDDGTSLPSFDTLEAQSGQSRSAVYRGLKALREANLIKPAPRGAYRIFPGRDFAGRRQRPEPTPSPSSGTPPPPQSQSWDSESQQRDCQSQQRDVLLRRRVKDVVDETRDEPDGGGGVDVVVELLMEREHGRFKRADAARLVDRYTAARVRDAIDSGLAMKARSKLRKGMREFIVWFLSREQPLFREVDEDRERAKREQLTARLNAIVVPRLQAHPGSEQVLLRAFGTVRQTVAAGVVTEADLEQHDADALFDLLLERARRSTGTHGHPPPTPGVRR